jgi:hypothetical protein
MTSNQSRVAKPIGHRVDEPGTRVEGAPVGVARVLAHDLDVEAARPGQRPRAARSGVKA